jgi:hypothetical protein
MISSHAPSYSGASSFLTRIPSLYILKTEKASEIPTVIGRPSGTATTTNTATKLMCYGSLETRIAHTDVSGSSRFPE